MKSHDSAFTVSDYVADAKRSNIPHVSITLRQNILDYVTGVTNTSSQLMDTSNSLSDEAVKRRRVGEWTLEDVLDEEVCVGTRNSIMNNDALSIDIKSIMHVVNETQLKSLSSKPVTAAKATVAMAAPPAVKPSSSKPEAHIPIIIVPAARSALINLRNCGDFFQNNAYLDPNIPTSGITVLPSSSNPHLVRIKLASALQPHKKADFHLVDNPASLSADQWRRVIAMVVTGQTWQLDNMPSQVFGKATPSEIFAKILGFYYYMEGDAVNPAVLKWNVKRVELSRNKRYNDAVVVTAFWKEIHNFLKTKAATLKLSY